jgi:F-type H+-transporting ATPase subunit gamma
MISGLCGAIHSGIGRTIRNELATDPNVKIICVGDKSRAILQRLFAKNILFVCNEVRN